MVIVIKKMTSRPSYFKWKKKWEDLWSFSYLYHSWLEIIIHHDRDRRDYNHIIVIAVFTWKTSQTFIANWSSCHIYYTCIAIPGYCHMCFAGGWHSLQASYDKQSHRGCGHDAFIPLDWRKGLASSRPREIIRWSNGVKMGKENWELHAWGVLLNKFYNLNIFFKRQSWSTTYISLPDPWKSIYLRYCCPSTGHKKTKQILTKRVRVFIPCFFRKCLEAWILSCIRSETYAQIGKGNSKYKM